MNGSMCLYFVHKQMYDCDKVDLKKFQNISCITYIGETFLWEMFDGLKSGGEKLCYCRLKRGRSVPAREDSGIDERLLM